MTPRDRRRLILALTLDVRRAHRNTPGALAIWREVRGLIDAADAAELDAAGTRAYVARWHTDLGQRAWDGIMARRWAGVGE